MPKIKSLQPAYADQPCSRCGSKKRISRTWKEVAPTFNGTTETACAQIVCTNKECQKVFAVNLAKEEKKRAVLRLQKEEKDKSRKAATVIRQQIHLKSKN